MRACIVTGQEERAWSPDYRPCPTACRFGKGSGGGKCLERLLAKLRYLQPSFTGFDLQLAFVVTGSGVTARFAAFVTLRIAKPISLGIQ